jgi:hypothetical protein
MTKEQLFTYHEDMCVRLYETLKKKNADYTANSSSPFANFERAELLGITSTEKAFLVRMADKLSRLGSVIGSSSATDETVQDTLDDLANYCILLSAYIEAKKPTPPKAVMYIARHPNGYPELDCGCLDCLTARSMGLKPEQPFDHAQIWEARCP